MRRRGFLGAIGATAPAAMASALAYAGRRDRRRLLVLVELKGGNDGLNTVVPYADPAYYRLRPTLAVARDAVLPLDERLGLHPSLAPLMPLWRAGEMAILQGVGYPEPSLSHFRSKEIWDAGSVSEPSLPGDWLGRALVGDAGIELIRLSLDGFDTHENQAARHAAILGELADVLVTLQVGVAEPGRWDSTLVLTHSEFGRRVAENATAGTDHGTAAVHFACGGRVRGGLYGKAPELARLDRNGNLLCGLDFRAIYATVLERWVGVPAFSVLGRRFEMDDVLRV